MSISLEACEPKINSANIFHCAPDWRLAPGWSDNLHDYDLWYVGSGLGRMTTSDGEVELYPGRAIWMRPGRRYEATQRPDARLRVTAIHFDLLRGGRAVPPSRVPALEVFDVTSTDYMTSALGHIVFLYLQSKQRNTANALIKAILLELTTSSRSPGEESALQRHHNGVIQPLLATIRNDLSRRFTIEDLAAKSGYTADHFVRLFRSITGQSPNQWIIAQRMERAVALLRESSHTVTQIADQLGYEDLAFFSRQFKKTMGVSPDQFRRRK